MKKILIAFDGHHFSDGALWFVKKLNDKSPVLATGVFLPQVDYASLWSYSGGGSSGNSFIPLLEDADAEKVKENIQRFEDFCKKYGIQYSIHKEYFDFALPELKKESRYADLLVISSESFYEQAGTDKPNEYLEEALQGIECPAIVIPELFDFPETNILAYDGSGSSVHAIKQFAYLFPELAKNQTLLVHAKNRNEIEVPEEENIMELARRHFPHLVQLRLEENSSHFFSTWMGQRKGAILVSGAFGRSGVSMLFRKSFVTNVIANHRLPVFIAHK